VDGFEDAAQTLGPQERAMLQMLDQQSSCLPPDAERVVGYASLTLFLKPDIINNNR
jgi:hypothetical protein